MKITKKIKNEQIFSLVLLGLLAVILSLSTVSAASDVYVANSGTDADGFGTADNPYKTIGYGIEKVDTDGNVNLAAGTYTGTGNRNITISKNVAIIGSGMNDTIIDAEGKSKVFTIENLVSVKIKNLTIQNANNSFPLGGIDPVTGDSIPETEDSLGGAINSKIGILEIENVKFVNNHGHKGAAIANYLGDLTVLNSIFLNNHDNEWGGAIMNMGTLIVRDSTFTSNLADTEGGAIMNHIDATITGSTFEDNKTGSVAVGAPGKGGAIFSVTFLFNNNLIINNNRFLNNRVLNIDESYFVPGLNGNQQNEVYLGFHDEYPFTGTADITNNWWGQSTGPITGQIYMYGSKGSYTYSPWLTSDPRPPGPVLKPDLTVSSVSIPQNPVAGQNYQVTATVANTGSGNSGAFNVKLAGLSGLNAQTQRVNTLNAGSSTTVTWTWTPTSAGTFTGEFTADSGNEVTESNETNNIKTQQVIVTETAPVAAFTATPTIGTAPLNVQFTDQSTGTGITYAWDFNNDGVVDSALKNPAYTYSTPGKYTVKLTVTNSADSNSLTKTDYITVNIPAPVANFTATPTSGTVPLNVQFSDKSTGSGLTYQWDFNNDGVIDSTSQNPAYTYSSTGKYTVKLIVSGPGGTDDEIKTNYITVNDAAPVANFIATPTSGTAPLQVQFSDQSTGNSITYSWDFTNDGIVDSTAQNPSYTYNTAGTYTVKLKVSNSGGTDEEVKTITVTGIPDLEVTSITLPANPVAGGSYNVPVIIKNIGTTSAGAFTVEIFDGATSIGSITVNNLAAGAQTTQTFSWNPTAAGTHTIKAVADSKNEVSESNEANNEKTQDIIVGENTKPDLQITAMTLPANPVRWGTYYIPVTIKNTGSAPSGTFSVRIYDGNTVIATVTVNNLAAGAQTTRNIRWRPTTAGTHTIKAVADYNNQVMESNENNNQLTRSVTVRRY